MKLLNWLIFFTTITWHVSAQPSQQWKLYYDSTQIFWGKDWNKTVLLLEKAERSAISDLGIYNENYLTILNDLGTSYWKVKDYNKAGILLTRSVQLKKEVYPEDDKEIILSISNLAAFYAEQGLWKKSKSLYHRILSKDVALVSPDIYVSAAQNLVALYDLNQQIDSADFLLRKVEKLVIPKSFMDYQHQFYSARIHRKLQEYPMAQRRLETLIKTLSTETAPEMIDLFIQSIQEQGILYLETGAYSQAEKNLLKAYGLVTSLKRRGFLLTELSNNLAQVYDKLNIYDKALTYYNESLTRCKLAYEENSLPCAILLNNIAGIQLKENKVEQSIQNYLKVLDAFEKLLPISDPLYITSVNNLATAYRKSNQLTLASEYLSKAEKLLENNGMANSDLAATVLNNIAVINTADGEYEKAAVHYKNAYEIKRTVYGENSVLLLDLISNLAVTYWALNNHREGIPLFKKSMELATKQVTYVFPNLNEKEQIQFYHKLSEDFERFNTIAIQWARHDPQLISQMFQNRAIIKSLQFFTQQRRRNLIQVRNDSSLNNLVSKLKYKRDALGHLYQLPLQEIQNGSQGITSLEQNIDELEKTISQQTSEGLYGNELTATEISWQSLAPRLQANEAIVEMIRFRKYDRQNSRKKDFFGFTDSVYYAAIIIKKETKSIPEWVVLKQGSNLESRYYYYYKNAMKYDLDDGLSYEVFWRPIQNKLAGKRRVYLSSDGVYHKININTLKDPQTSAYILEKFDIIHLLNPTQVLASKTVSKPTKQSAVLIGDPVFDVDLNGPRERTVEFDHFMGLPGTQAELKAIDIVLKGHSWKTTLLLKGAATEANLKLVHSPTILHLASHGFFSSEIVALNIEAKKEFLFHSGIVLTGANKSLSSGSTAFQNDGIVTAFEVMNLDLTNTQLVVLSACETGLGRIENGEGVFGLQRSFMQAGAKNVLISLWKVDDEITKDLMIKFYQYLALGNSMSKSLKQAQLDQSKLVSNPALWGAFVLVGNN